MEQKQGLSLRGFARVQILENGKIVGDSGLKGSNRITEVGLSNFLVQLLAGSVGSSVVNFAQLGTGTEPATDSTRLPGEINDGGTDSYDSCSKSTLTASTGVTMRWYGTFGSGDGFVTKTWPIRNIGLYNTNTTNVSLACGQTYAISTVDTNQDIQYTNEWQIDTTA